jgi:predicted metal-dependent hydrolase
LSEEAQQDLFGPSHPVTGGQLASVDEGSPAFGGVVFQRSLKARNYRLTLKRDGTAVATIPLRGSEREALRFVAQHSEWLERARVRQSRKPRGATVWVIGTHVLWRGEMTEIRRATSLTDKNGTSLHPFLANTHVVPARPMVCLAADVFRVPSFSGDLRPTLEAHFARRGKVELPARTWELAALCGIDVKQVTVRDQRSRWGSCSLQGTISLNWRLVQTPDFVRDYIIYHELMHLREMNHSARFWARVEEVCPAWRDAELWLKRNGSLLGL